jgi:hypothetical protein
MRGANTSGDDFSIEGADQFLALSKALKAAGQTELRKALHKGLKDGAAPLKQVAKDAAGESFPKGGGLADLEAKRVFRVQVKTGRHPGVTLSAAGKYVNLKLLNNYGRIRHPVYADKKNKTRREWRWVNQDIPGGLGWFDRAIKENVKDVLPALERAIGDMAERIVREVRRG